MSMVGEFIKISMYQSFIMELESLKKRMTNDNDREEVWKLILEMEKQQKLVD